MKNPLVSICCITYNHVSYIRQCLDSFMMQKTNFAFEIILHDDASTDGTQEIIKEYINKYPGVIHPIFQTENQYSKGQRGMNSKYNYPRAKGKYIALCEGDDYWTDPFKLQKQVDFMEQNVDCSLSFHSTLFEDQISSVNNVVYRPPNIPNDNKFSIHDVILEGGGFMSTNSMLFKTNHVLERPNWMEIAPVGDIPLMLLLASKGSVGYLDEVMSVYRKNSIGSWTLSMKGTKKRKIHFNQIQQTFTKFDDWTNYEYHDVIKKKKFKNRINYYKTLVLVIFMRFKKFFKK